MIGKHWPPPAWFLEQQVVYPTDLLELSTAPGLIGWWRAGQSQTTISTTPYASGTSPPAVGFGGNLAQHLGLNVTIETDPTKYRWSKNNGWIWEASNQAIPLGGVITLSGVDVSFPNVPYHNDNVFQAVSSKISNIALTGSENDLDNSSVYASKGWLIQNDQTFNGLQPAWQTFPLPTTLGGMGTKGSAATFQNGLNVPFSAYWTCELPSANISTQPVCALSWSSSASPSGNTGNYINFKWFNLLASGGARFSVERRAAGAAAVNISKTITQLDNGLHLYALLYDGITLKLYIDGILQFSIAWSSAALTLIDRLLFGAIDLGSAGAIQIPYCSFREVALYNVGHNTSQLIENLRAMS